MNNRLKSLHKLVIEKDYEGVLHRLKSTVEGKEIDSELNHLEDGHTPIHLAALAKDLRMIQILLAARPRLDIHDGSDRLPKEVDTTDEIKEILINAELSVAAWYGDLGGAVFLIKKGVHPNTSVRVIGLHDHTNAEHSFTIDPSISALIKRENMLSSLIQATNQAWRYRDRDLGLFEAIADNNADAVRGLVNYYGHLVNCSIDGGGSRKWAIAEAGATPLAYSIYKGYLTTIYELLRLGADRTHPAVIRNLEALPANSSIRSLFHPAVALQAVAVTECEVKVRETEVKVFETEVKVCEAKVEPSVKAESNDNNATPSLFDNANELYHRGKVAFKQAKAEQTPSEEKFTKAFALLSSAKDSFKLFKPKATDQAQQAMIDKRLGKIKDKTEECKKVIFK